MKRIYKKMAATFILIFILVFAISSTVSAATYCNITLTINGQTQTLRLPIDLNSTAKDSTKTFRFVYTYKDGKWILTQQDSPLPGKDKPIKTPPSTPTPPIEEPNKPPTTSLSADENKMLELVNSERLKAGLKPLKSDMRLVDLSRKKSKDMIDKKYFSHTSPTYGTPFDALKNNGISYRYAGENLAGAPTVERAHSALMNSPGHRANILNPNYTHIGIGIIDGGPYGKMYTQTFIGIK